MASEIIALNPQATQVQQTHAVRSSSILANPEQVKVNMRAAELFAASDLVPTQYRNKPANCFIAINRAQRLGVDEMYFLEKTFVVGGKLGMAAELAIELANTSGRFRGLIKFRLFGEGEARGCTAFATLAADGDVVENTVTYAMAKADGWTKNNKWNSLRDQMLQYRAGVFLARLYAGGSLGGMYTREELEDVAAQSAKPIGSSKTDGPSQIAAPANDVPDLANEEIVAIEDGIRAKLEGISSVEALDDLWRSGVSTQVREVGAIDKPAMNRIIAAFSQKKNAILKAQEDDAEAGETPDPEPPADHPLGQQSAQDDALNADQAATLRKVKEDLGIDPDATVVIPRDQVQKALDALRNDEDEQPAKHTPPPPAAIEVPNGDDGKPAWNRWTKTALEQLAAAGKGDYGLDWLDQWTEANAVNRKLLEGINADWANRITTLHAKVLNYFMGQVEDEALEHFPTIAVQYGEDDSADWMRFERDVMHYIRDLPNARVAKHWWDRQLPVIQTLRRVGEIGENGYTGARSAELLEGHLARKFPQFAK